MGTDNRIQVRIDDNLSAWLHNRADRMHNGGSPDVQARLELGLWKSVLDLELRRIRLTLPQACVIMAVCNSWMLDATIAGRTGLVYAECYDAFRIAREKDRFGISSYAAQYGIDEQELLDYLGGLGPAADAALRDAITRWWEMPDWEREDTVEGFKAVGLRVTGPALYAVYDSTGQQVADLGRQESDEAALAAADALQGIIGPRTVMRLEPAAGRAFSVGPPRPAK